MNFTNEQLTKAKAAKSAEELIALAKENGMEMTEEEAAKYFADLHKEGELSDNELDNVSGGWGCEVGLLSGGEGTPNPKYHKGDILYIPTGSPSGFSRIEIVSDGNWCTNEYFYDTVCYYQINNDAVATSFSESRIGNLIK